MLILLAATAVQLNDKCVGKTLQWLATCTEQIPSPPPAEAEW